MYINCEIIKSDVHIWERLKNGQRTHLVIPCEWSCYIQDPDGSYTALDGTRATFHEFDTRFDLMRAMQDAERRGLKVFEGDIPPDLKALAKHYPFDENNIPKLHISYLDIEVDYKTVVQPENTPIKVRKRGGVKHSVTEVGVLREADDLSKYEVYDEEFETWILASRSSVVYDGPVGHASANRAYAPINAIALYNDWEDRTYIIAVPPPNWGEDSTAWKSMLAEEFIDDGDLYLVGTEKELLEMTLRVIDDADGLCGWNSEFFDFPYILARVEAVLGTRGMRKLSFPGGSLPKMKEVVVMGQTQYTATYGGRLLMDYLMFTKKFELEKRASYKLESVTEEDMPELAKLEYSGTLEQLYKRDFNHFIRYNKRDTVVLYGFEKIKGFAGIANLLYHMSSGRFRDVAGTLRLADMAIVNYCHDTLDSIVPNSIMPDQSGNEDNSDDEGAEGAFVLVPKAGLQTWGGAVDITSLYPSAIRSCNISPEMLVGQFDEAVLAFEHIYYRKDVPLTLRYDDGRPPETASAVQWRERLMSLNYCVSGYGTVFDQSKGQGVIPAILTDWFAKRKHYQTLKKNAASELEQLIRKNTFTS